MDKYLLLAAAVFALALPASAQEAETAPLPNLSLEPAPNSSPNQIVEQAPASEWVRIAAEDLLVMTLAPDRDGNAREVVIQLMPAPFSQGWVENIRTLARADWYDGVSINRVQDNYVVQWGDPNGEDANKAKSLPEGLQVLGEEDYRTDQLFARDDPRGRPRINYTLAATMMRNARIAKSGTAAPSPEFVAAMEANAPIVREAVAAGKRGDADAAAALNEKLAKLMKPIEIPEPDVSDAYASLATIVLGWPVAGTFGNGEKPDAWPVHCYGMVGVGRDYSPDTGSGAELYTVIGHAPRHLDRNIALVGRVVEGIEHLASLPRGSGDLGFYTDYEADKRVPILSVRVASDLPASQQPSLEYLSTEGETFARYAEARANRRDPFFIVPAGGADICNIPVPVRRIASKK